MKAKQEEPEFKESEFSFHGVEVKSEVQSAKRAATTTATSSSCLVSKDAAQGETRRSSIHAAKTFQRLKLNQIRSFA